MAVSRDNWHSTWRRVKPSDGRAMSAAGPPPQQHVEVICGVSVTRSDAPNYHVDPWERDPVTSFCDPQSSVSGSGSGFKVTGDVGELGSILI